MAEVRQADRRERERVRQTAMKGDPFPRHVMVSTYSRR